MKIILQTLSKKGKKDFCQMIAYGTLHLNKTFS